MNKSIVSACCLILSTLYFGLSFAQAGQWTWLRGSNTPGSAGNYGTQGVALSTNEPPAVYEPCEWTDLNGNFWMFGGKDFNQAFRNDLWKYNPSTNLWTWMSGTNNTTDPGIYGTQGVPAAANHPPPLGFGIDSWVDKNNNLWLFGGFNTAGGGIFSDLWKYDISINEWTWVKGPGTAFPPGVYGTQGVPNAANYPGYRCETSAAWTDTTGDLWFIGGQGNGDRNDLWRFNIASNNWTWMNGSQYGFVAGVRGIKGVEDSLKTPCGRFIYTRWRDNNNNLWFFGGDSTDFYNHSHTFNDLWRYNIQTNRWAWINGDTATTVDGVPGTKCVASPANVPSSRYETRAAWTDNNGDFWMFGGASTDSFFVRNDLWKYCINLNQWIWISGDTSYNAPGSWGTKGIASATNKPNARAGSVGWTDHKGNLYLFGGATYPSYSSLIVYNDLWKFTIDTTCASCALALPVAHFTSSDTVFCDEAGKCISFFDHSTGNPTSWQWNFTGASPDTSSMQNPDSICYYTPGSYPVQLIVTGAGGTDTLNVSPLIVLATPPPPPTITSVGDTLRSSHGVSYQWYYNGGIIPGATDSFYVCSQSGAYSVRVTDALGCSQLSTGFSGCITKINDYQATDGSISIYPNPTDGTFTISVLDEKLSSVNYQLSIFDLLGEIVQTAHVTADLHQPTTIDISSLPKSVYIVLLTSEKDKSVLLRNRIVKD